MSKTSLFEIRKYINGISFGYRGNSHINALKQALKKESTLSDLLHAFSGGHFYVKNKDTKVEKKIKVQVNFIEIADG